MGDIPTTNRIDRALKYIEAGLLTRQFNRRDGNSNNSGFCKTVTFSGCDKGL